MKIYKSCTIDIATWTIEAEDSYEYDGPIAECGGSKGGKPPATPDPNAVSAAQTQSNQQTAAYNAALNRGNVTTPLGSQTFSQRTDPRTGAPIWDEQITLSPEQQRLYDQQMGQNERLGGISGGMMDNLEGTYGTPIDTSAAPALRDPGQAQTYQQNINRSLLPALRNAPQMQGYGDPSQYQGTMDNSNLPGLQGNVNQQSAGTADAYRTTANRSGLPALQGSANLQTAQPAGNYQTSVDRSGLPGMQSQVNVNGPELQGQLDNSNLPQLYGADDLQAARTRAEQAIYQKQASYLDPQWQQRDTAFRTRMANQGVTEGSEAWRNAMDDENRSRSFDYDQARTSAITGGGDELARLTSIAQGNRGQIFGENVTGGQFQNNARQQALAEALSRGQFNNQARGQQFDEGSADAALYNTATNAQNTDRLNFANQNNQTALAGAELANSARGQGFNEGTADTELFNRGVSANNADRLAYTNQANQANLTNADFANRARAQGFGENLSGAQLFNQASDARNSNTLNFTGATNRDALAEQQAQNQARAQGFGEGTTDAQFANSAISAGNADQLNYTNAANNARQQALQEMYTARNQPLNEFNALRSASPVTMPQFQQAPAVSMNPTDTSGNVYRSYQGDLNVYGAGQAGQNATTSGLFGLGGSIAGQLPWGSWFSDERLKDNINKVGELPDETNLYSYTFKGDNTPQVGVMAQEVEQKDPAAVSTDPATGYKKVNYRRVLSSALRKAIT